VNPTVKQRAEDVLSRLGIPMSTAIDMYLNHFTLSGREAKIQIGVWENV
jgi:antitoxin component of RelBE/YafQ-DinJ toxin-antitoxin module